MRETAEQKRIRYNRERYAALRAAITPAMRAQADADEPDTEYPAGERLTIRPGRQRPQQVDEGEVRCLALADSLEARGFVVTGRTMSFGIGAGHAATLYSVNVRRAA